MTSLTELPPALLRASPELGTFYRAWDSCRKDAPGGPVLMPTLSQYLDRPSFELQPFVSVAELHAENDLRIRLFGTGLAVLAGQDFTQQNLETIYNTKAMQKGWETAWRYMGHPAGYTCIRAIRAHNAALMECECICLPLQPPQGVPRCMITMMHVPDHTPHKNPGDDLSTVLDFKFLAPIDIGAGLPL